VPQDRKHLTRAERKQRNVELKWGAESNDRSWMKYARCGLCRKTFAVNNNPAREVRVEKYRGLAVCSFCQRNPEWKVLADAFLLVAMLANKPKLASKINWKKVRKQLRKHRDRKNGSYAGGPN
jgi:hypothetical protein